MPNLDQLQSTNDLTVNYCTPMCVLKDTVYSHRHMHMMHTKTHTLMKV